jgi:splicing factor 3B subunit 3
MALLAFQGRLVAGVGKSLRLYDMGKKKLLRKVENKVGSSFLFPIAYLMPTYLLIYFCFY